MVKRRLTGLAILGMLFFVSCARTTPESSNKPGAVAPETHAAKISETAGDSTEATAETVAADRPVDHDEHSAAQHLADEAHGHRHGVHGHSAPKTTVRHPDAIEIVIRSPISK